MENREIKSIKTAMSKDEIKRPIIKDYFGKDATLSEVHQTYISQPELFKYAQALDIYIDMLEQESDKKAIAFAEWLSDNALDYVDACDYTEFKIVKGQWLYKLNKDWKEYTTTELLNIFNN